MPALAVAALAVATSSSPVAAFTFSDGTKTVCVARGQVVAEIEAEPTDPFNPRGRTALAERTADGWRIVWNMERVRSLPPEVRDFLFFHECAHARVPTDVELEANCAGLLDMRAAGRAGPAFEAKLRRFFPGNEYWQETFRCADANTKRPAPPAAPPG